MLPRSIPMNHSWTQFWRTSAADLVFCVCVLKFHRMSSRSANSIYFHHCHILRSPFLHLLSMSVIVCNYMVRCCCVSVRDCRPISCLKRTSTHKHNLLGFLFQKNKSILPEKHKPLSSFFFFIFHLITSSHPAKVNLAQRRVRMPQNLYTRVMPSAAPMVELASDELR